MADRKISDLTALTTPATGDLIPIVDISEAAAADKNKSITVGELLRGAPDGTAAAPGFAFESDGGNGMFLGGTDILAFSTGGTQAVTIDASQRVGLGTSSPQAFLDIADASNQPSLRLSTAAASNFLKISRSASTGHYTFASEENGSSIIFATDPDGTGAQDRVTIDRYGKVGIGATVPNEKLTIADSGSANVFIALQNSTTGTTSSDGWYIGAAGTELQLYGKENGPISFTTNSTEKVRLTADGKLLVGTSSARTVDGFASAIQAEGTDAADSSVNVYRNSNNEYGAYLTFGKSRSTSLGGSALVSANDEIGVLDFCGADGTDTNSMAARIAAHVDGTPGSNDMPGRLVFSTTADGASSPTERMRIQNDGLVMFGTTTGFSVTSSSATGAYVSATSGLVVARNADIPGFFMRQTDDGDLIRFVQGGNTEGSISVSGSTVSYNGAHLSRWSQLPGGATREEILRGTVLSNIDEMCDWGEEENEQLNRMKVSDVEGDPNASGVFQCWDDDDDTYTDDFYCAMTGDFIIRIAEGVTVQRGQLLMSAGDGTAKPQDDDIIRSKTIAKVTSTHVTCTYDDGSYCVPCVLMAC